MKLIIDIEDNKATGFMEMIRAHSYVKARHLSESEAALIGEIVEIKKAFRYADKIRTGKLKGRPASDFLNDL